MCVDKTLLLSTLLQSTKHGWDSLQDCSCRQIIAPVDRTQLGQSPGQVLSMKPCSCRQNIAPVVKILHLSTKHCSCRQDIAPVDIAPVDRTRLGQPPGLLLSTASCRSHCSCRHCSCRDSTVRSTLSTFQPDPGKRARSDDIE